MTSSPSSLPFANTHTYLFPQDSRNGHPYTEPAAPKVYWLEDYLARTFDDKPSIVERKIIVPGGLSVLAAQPKMGKSLLAQQLAIDRARGEPWLGFDTSPGPTLYINAEILDSELQNRFFRMCRERDVPPGMIALATVMGYTINEPDGARLIEGFIAETHPDLMILDPVSPLLFGDDSKQEYVKPFLQTLAQWRSRYGVAILLIHHQRKPSRERKTKPTAHDISGTGLWHRYADSIIIADGQPGLGNMTLSFELRHDKVDPITLYQNEELWWHPSGLGAFEDLRGPLGLLYASPLGYNQWAQMMKAKGIVGSDATARRRIDECRKRNLVVPHDSKYELSTKARDAFDAEAPRGATTLMAG